MLDTLMALWNQDRRKRTVQAILTFFLMCIGISLLLVITSRSVESQYQKPKASVGSANPTVPTFGNTVVPDVTPTVSVVIGTQSQPTPVAKTIQPTPVATTTQPCSATPSSAMNQTYAFYANALLQPSLSPTPQRGRSTPRISSKRLDGGGPVSTPVLPTPTPALQSTPTPTQHGWVSNCTTSNSLSTVAGSDIITLLAQNIWFILGSALLCTMLFYALLFTIKRRMQV